MILNICNGADTSEVTATASDVLNEKIIVDPQGDKIVGNIQSKSKTTYYATTEQQTMIESKIYCSGKQILSPIITTNLEAEKILSGTTVTINNGKEDIITVEGSAKRTYRATLEAVKSETVYYEDTWIDKDGNESVEQFSAITFNVDFEPGFISVIYNDGTARSSWELNADDTAGNVNKIACWEGSNYWYTKESKTITSGDINFPLTLNTTGNCYVTVIEA